MKLTIEIWKQDNGYVAAMIESPAFVDRCDLFHDTQEALTWVHIRCSVIDPLRGES